MGAAIVTGMQGGARGVAGGDLTDPQAASACAKHFIGYSAPKTGHDRTPVELPERVLQQYYVPPFRAAVEAGALTVMEGYHELNDAPQQGPTRAPAPL